MDFRIKIGALFHDPPHKPWVLKGHEAQGKAFVSRVLGGAGLTDREWGEIKEADRIASGADRYEWLKELTVDPRSELEFVHPLQGEPILVPGTVTGRAFQLAITDEQVDRLGELLETLAEELVPLAREPRKLFLVLWRFLPDLLSVLEGKSSSPGSDRFKLGALWELLPADTRLPDHPVIAHTSLVSAIASILLSSREVALVRVALGPVQGFIAASRKLSDLWASSTMLAEATWHAMLPIVEKLGPDHVLYPSLRFEPRLDRWLLGELGIGLSELANDTERDSAIEKGLAGCGFSDPKNVALFEVLRSVCRHMARNLRVPSLPNLFTALVPAGEGEWLAKQCEACARKWWEDLVREYARLAGSGDDFEGRAARQAGDLLEVFTSVVPWPVSSEPETWTGHWNKKEPHVRRALSLGRLIANEKRAYKPSGGALYADVNEQAELLVGAAKLERYAGRIVRVEEGLKCSVCGEREVLGAGDFWEQRARGFAGRRDTNKLKENEQLCGICTAKRHFTLPELEGTPFARHPSTGEVASSLFKLEVVRRAAQAGPGSGELYEAIREFVGAAQKAAQSRVLEESDLRVYCAAQVDMAARESGDECLREFAKIDGQWLLPFPRGEREAEGLEDLGRAARKLRAAAARLEIPPPRPYLAVVEFDGDEMGKWISGTHERFPRFLESLHSRVRAELGHLHPGLLDRLEGTPRLVTPAFHAALSAAASAFARISAQMTVEGEEIPGHLVYAGGDDALFVAPIPEAIELVRRLRLRFSGYPRAFDGATTMPEATPWVAAKIGETGFPRPVTRSWEADRLGLAFGEKATASAGMCVFHYTWPLGSALEVARHALERAKRRGRNRLAIVVQRRSGSISECFLPFGTAGSEPYLAHFERLVSYFQQGVVSPRLASFFRAETARLLGRELEGGRPSGGAGSDHGSGPRGEKAGGKKLLEVAEVLAKRLVARRDVTSRVDEAERKQIEATILALGLGARSGDDERQGCIASAIRAIRNWAEVITVAAFLAREGEG